MKSNTTDKTYLKLKKQRNKKKKIVIYYKEYIYDISKDYSISLALNII
ncbi:hypothetical protein ACTPEO_07620 [Clostridioides difficile]